MDVPGGTMIQSQSARFLARWKPVLSGIVAVGVASLLSACTMIPLPGGNPAATTPPPSTSPVERSTEITTAAWEVPLDAIGQPVVADGVALVYASTPRGVNAHAFSVADGKQLWTQPVHPGLDAPSVPPLEPVVTRTAAGKSAAIFLQATAPPPNNSGYEWWTTPVAFDLSSGKELYRGRAELVSTRPFACDELQDMCFIAFDETFGTVEHWVDLESGDNLSGPEVNPLTGNFRPVGKELYSVLSGGVETLAHVSYGEVLWEVELGSIFGKGATTDMGWHFTYSEKLDLYVGSVGINPTNFAPGGEFAEQTFSLNLRESTKTVGFRASSGRVLWTADGSQLECAETVGTASSKLEEGGTLFLFVASTSTAPLNFPQGNTWADIRKWWATIITGEAAWESKPVEVHSWETTGLIPSAGHGDFVIAGTYYSSALLDARTGKPSGASFDDAFVCTKATTYTLPPNGPTRISPAATSAPAHSSHFHASRAGPPRPPRPSPMVPSPT